MSDRTQYLLRTGSQTDSFTARYGEGIRRNSGTYAEWIRSLDCCVWTDVVCRPEHEEFVTGIICLLYIRGEVNISFDSTAERVRREPGSLAEFLEWAKAAGYHGPVREYP